MNKQFQIGTFRFRLIYPQEVQPPVNFMIFETAEGTPEYTYEIHVTDHLPEPEGQVIARRPDLLVLEKEEGECRYIGVKGQDWFYACYTETSPEHADILLVKKELEQLNIDPVFSSLLALERHLGKKDQVILHCAYTVYQGEAILFSAPSETGKTTQATLWETYRGSRTVNGDRSLLGKKDGRWMAGGWPVCGTSEVCHNEEFPIRAIVMLSQGKENIARKLSPGEAFPLLYSQVTVNRWNTQAHLHTMDLLEDILSHVPVFHLACTISEKAVECLEQQLGDSVDRR